MRILQVVAVFSRHGEYGGPSTVAINQCTELARRGHRVTLVAGDFDAAAAAVVPGVEVRTFPLQTVGPAPSFTRIVAPSLQSWLATHASEFDVAHVHLSRDFVTLAAARTLRRQRVPVHVQTHGMINPRTAFPQRLVDAALTRPALAAAQSVFYLNDRELRTLTQVAGSRASYVPLPNGIRVPTAAETPTSRPESGVDADQPAAAAPEVLFLARLHPRKRPVAFTQAAAQLAASHRSSAAAACFTIVGPDEGEAAAVDREIAALAARHPEAAARIRREPAVGADKALARVARSDIYVLPSCNEPLPMSVLEAMATARPVIVTESCGFADLVRESGAGVVVPDDSVTALATAIATLLDDLPAARAQGERGRVAVRERWGMGEIAARLEERYRAALPPRQPRRPANLGLLSSSQGATARSSKVRVGLLDWRSAGNSVGVVYGPLEPWCVAPPGSDAAAPDPSAADLLELFRRMCAAGVEYRVGLLADPTSLRWRVADPHDDWVLPPNICDTTDIEGAVARCFAHRPPGAVAARVAQRYGFVSFDHGFGDSHVMIEMLAALTGRQDRPAGFLALPPLRNQHPVLRTIARALREHPGAYVSEVGHRLRQRVSAPAAAPAPTSDSAVSPAAPDSAAVVSVFARSDEHFTAALRACRTHLGQDQISVAGLMAHRLAAAFVREIPDTSPRVAVVVDLRRFLAGGVGTWANLAAVAPVTFSADAATFGARYLQAVRSTTLPGRLGASLLAAYLRTRGGRGVPQPASATGPLALSISDMTRHPAAAKIAWSQRPSDQGQHVFCIALPPSGPHGVAIAVNQVGEQVHLTATFHRGRLTVEQVRTALQAALTVDPAGHTCTGGL